MPDRGFLADRVELDAPAFTLALSECGAPQWRTKAMPRRNQGPRTMTVAELREAIARFDDDASVVFANDYGDHSHTMQACGIEGVTESHLVESAYSVSNWALPDEEDEDDDDDEKTEALYVVIR